MTSNKKVRQLEERIRELERQLGRKTMEAEILGDALDKSGSKKPSLLAGSLKKDGYQASHPVEVLTDNGAPYTAKDTRIFAGQLGLRPCFTPVKSPQSNGLSEAFVNTLKRDYVRVTPLPDANTALGLIDGWIEDYNDNHPHSGLKWRSPREFIAARTATA